MNLRIALRIKQIKKPTMKNLFLTDLYSRQKLCLSGKKTVNQFLKILLSLIIITTSSFSNAINETAVIKSTKVNLKYVFEKEISLTEKYILKLYDNNTYEFLYFIIKNKKPKVIREKGIYRLIRNKLKLKLKSSNQKELIKHPKRYYYFSEKGLYKSKAKMRKGIFNTELYQSSDKKYQEVFYVDSVFGIVSNNKNVYNKLAIPKLNKKNESIKIEEKRLVEDVVLIEEYRKKAFKENAKLSINKFKMIKAVIIVGNDATQFIYEQRQVASYLKNLGIAVVELYTPNCKWEDVKKASNGAHILIYAGHGITIGKEKEKQGTLYLNEGIIEGEQLVNGLKLNKNALVLFNHACSSAGSSGFDDYDIGIEEATRRVEDYAKPFIKLNAGCYYANNYYNYLIPMLTKFFSGVTIKDIYNNDASTWTKIENRKIYSFNKKYEVAVASQICGYVSQITTINGFSVTELVNPGKSYDIAYVGIPEFTVNDFFK